MSVFRPQLSSLPSLGGAPPRFKLAPELHEGAVPSEEDQQNQKAARNETTYAVQRAKTKTRTRRKSCRKQKTSTQTPQS